MSDNLTLFNLFNFMPLNDKEKELYTFDKSIYNILNTNLDNNFFYLGGQIKMTHTDIVNLDSIQKVRDIYLQKERDYGGPCNSWEAASIYRAQKELEVVESMIKAYNLIMKIREKENLR